MGNVLSRPVRKNVTGISSNDTVKDKSALPIMAERMLGSVTRKKVLLEEERLLGKHTLPYIIPQERSIDIDTPIDFKIAELILSGEATL